MDQVEYFEPTDDFSVIQAEYDLKAEVLRLRQAGHSEVAAHIQTPFTALVRRPPDWQVVIDAAAELSSFHQPPAELEHVRHDVLRSVLPLLHYLPLSA